MEYTIFCPYHLQDENLRLPDSYQNFEGEVDCSPPAGEPPKTLKIRVARGLLVDADRV